MRLFIYFFLVACSFKSYSQTCDPNTQSLLFDGSTSYVNFSLNNNYNLTEKLSIEAWINATAWVPIPLYGTILSKHGWTLGERGFALRAGGNGQLSFVIAGVDQGGNYVGWQEFFTNPGTLQLNKWHHVAGVFDKKKMKMYIDGVLMSTKNFKGTIATSPGYNLRIGRLADDGAPNGRYWQGYIDEVRLWEKALSQNDIIDHMNEHINSNSNDLVGYWRFDNCNGSTIADYTIGGSIANLNNATCNTDVPFTNGIVRPIVTQIGGQLFSSSLINNQWNFNGVSIAGETGITITPTQVGEYSVTAEILGCIATSLPFTISVLSTTDAFENKFSFIFNQFEQTISFQSAENINEATISIFDNNGKNILRKEKIIPGEKYNLASQPAGIYHVLIDYNNYRYSKNIFCY